MKTYTLKTPKAEATFNQKIAIYRMTGIKTQSIKMNMKQASDIIGNLKAGKAVKFGKFTFAPKQKTSKATTQRTVTIGNKTYKLVAIS